MSKKRTQSRGRSVSAQVAADADAIDLASLGVMHPLLPPDMAGVMITRAALGLQRNKHSSGTALQMDVERAVLRCILAWPEADLRTAKQHDRNRITEDGAEAIALAVAHRIRGWCVRRRLQRGEYADWLLEYRGGGKKRLVALEVSGVDCGSIADNLRKELAQVAKCTEGDERWAGVVGFEKPEAALRPAEVRAHGR